MDKAKLNSKIFFIFAQISVVLHRNQHNYDKMKLEFKKFYWLLLFRYYFFSFCTPCVQWKVS